jgi:hypothetical protein
MASAAESLHSHDLEIVVAGLETVLAPVVEMITRRHSAGGARALADREELRERAGTRDGWLVDAGASADVVGAAIGGDCAERCETLARVVAAVVFYYVVFGLWAVEPAVDGQVRASADAVGA